MACLGVMGHGIGRSPVRTLHEIHLGTEVVAHAVRANRALLDDRGIALAAEPPAGGVPVVANRDKIIQVLTNLLSNAAKFTPPEGGGVAVRTLVAGDEAVVEDTGSGRWGTRSPGSRAGPGSACPSAARSSSTTAAGSAPRASPAGGAASA